MISRSCLHTMIKSSLESSYDFQELSSSRHALKSFTKKCDCLSPPVKISKIPKTLHHRIPLQALLLFIYIFFCYNKNNNKKTFCCYLLLLQSRPRISLTAAQNIHTKYSACELQTSLHYLAASESIHQKIRPCIFVAATVPSITRKNLRAKYSLFHTLK